MVIKFSSVQFSRSVLSDSLRSHGLLHARPPWVTCWQNCQFFHNKNKKLFVLWLGRKGFTISLINAAAAAKSLQLCLTLCDPIDGSPLGSSVPRFSRQEYWSRLPFPSPMHESEKWKWSCSSRARLLATPWTAAYQAPPSMGFSRQEYWTGVPLPSPLINASITQIENILLLTTRRPLSCWTGPELKISRWCWETTSPLILKISQK